MTVAQSIIRTTFMIKELATWLEADVQKDGFCAPNSLSEMDLKIAENTFRHLADVCRDQRHALLANRPGPFEDVKNLLRERNAPVPDPDPF